MSLNRYRFHGRRLRCDPKPPQGFARGQPRRFSPRPILFQVPSYASTWSSPRQAAPLACSPPRLQSRRQYRQFCFRHHALRQLSTTLREHGTHHNHLHRRAHRSRPSAGNVGRDRDEQVQQSHSPHRLHTDIETSRHLNAVLKQKGLIFETQGHVISDDRVICRYSEWLSWSRYIDLLATLYNILKKVVPGNPATPSSGTHSENPK